MITGDLVKIFSSISEYDGQTGRIAYVSPNPAAPAPFVVQFGDAISEAFSERELISLKPIEPLWRETPLETHHAPHGASTRVQIYLGRIIAQKFIKSERRRLRVGWDLASKPDHTVHQIRAITETGRSVLRAEGFSPCLQCGKLSCSH